MSVAPASLGSQQYLYYSLCRRRVEKGYGQWEERPQPRSSRLSPVFRKLPGPVFICAKLSQTLHSGSELFSCKKRQPRLHNARRFEMKALHPGYPPVILYPAPRNSSPSVLRHACVCAAVCLPTSCSPSLSHSQEGGPQLIRGCPLTACFSISVVILLLLFITADSSQVSALFSHGCS